MTNKKIIKEFLELDWGKVLIMFLLLIFVYCLEYLRLMENNNFGGLLFLYHIFLWIFGFALVGMPFSYWIYKICCKLSKSELYKSVREIEVRIFEDGKLFEIKRLNNKGYRHKAVEFLIAKSPLSHFEGMLFYFALPIAFTIIFLCVIPQQFGIECLLDLHIFWLIFPFLGIFHLYYIFSGIYNRVFGFEIIRKTEDVQKGLQLLKKKDYIFNGLLMLTIFTLFFVLSEKGLLATYILVVGILAGISLIIYGIRKR